MSYHLGVTTEELSMEVASERTWTSSFCLPDIDMTFDTELVPSVSKDTKSMRGGRVVNTPACFQEHEKEIKKRINLHAPKASSRGLVKH